MAVSSTKPNRSTSWILGLLFLAHVLFAAQRLVLKSVPGRIAEVEDYRRRGAAQFHLGRSVETVAVVETLLRETPADAVIPFRGTDRGPIEQAAALLAPRILYRDDAVPATERIAGRPRAMVALAGGEPVPVVLIATGEALRLERR